MMKTALVLCFADPAVMGGRIDPLASNHRAHVFYQVLGLSLLAVESSLMKATALSIT